MPAAAPLTRILYVDDDVTLQMMTRLSLEKIGGFTVLVCGSGREAVEQAPAFAPDLVLLDVVMPGMDGLETLRALRGIASLGAVPVLFMTAKTQPDEIATLRAAGAADVVSKPYDPMGLSQQIREIWERL
jgi:CheY-like chemotaxis protein